MHRPSLTWAFVAAILVGAACVLGLLASSAAAAPTTGLANPAASPVATASTPALVITSATDGVVDGKDVSTGAGAVANPNDDGGGTADPNGDGGGTTPDPTAATIPLPIRAAAALPTRVVVPRSRACTRSRRRR
jgi:hypothetical protein